MLSVVSYTGTNSNGWCTPSRLIMAEIISIMLTLKAYRQFYTHAALGLHSGEPAVMDSDSDHTRSFRMLTTSSLINRNGLNPITNLVCSDCINEIEY